MKLIKTVGFILFLDALLAVGAQAQSKTDSLDNKKVSNAIEFFEKGETNGRVRNYFMSTINDGDLKNYWTNAIGGELAFRTASLHGLELGIRGNISYKLFSSDLLETDTLVGKSAKWEKELYDSSNPDENDVVEVIQTLYLKYKIRNSSIWVGRLDLNKGPLLLRRDGRMKPFVYQGVWAEFAECNNQSINLGFINGVSPRGDMNWYSIQEAIGINSNGVLDGGISADYRQQTNSKGIAVFGIRRSLFDEKLSVEGWNYYFHQLTNLTWLQAEVKLNSWFAGVQYVHQFADAYQSTLNFENRYYQPDEKGNVISTQFGKTLANKSVELSGAYLHAFNTGRFIFPRELGRDNFYVSQPRSWVDGFGDLDIYQVRVKWKPTPKKLSSFAFDTRLEMVQAPAIDNGAMNKYGMPSYYQATIASSYKFHGLFEGFQLTGLYVGRTSDTSLNLTPSQTFYKTNFHHINLILNLAF